MARLLCELLNAAGVPMDRLVLQGRVGAINLPDLVGRARHRYGVAITTTCRKHIDRDGVTVGVGQYAITTAEVQARAQAVLTTLS